MSTIHRTLVLNPVEPAPISMKLRTGIENVVEVEYLRQNGAPYNTDFGAQMYLIERTTGSVKAYILPSIDVINGRAQAYIPAGDIKDRNGYNVQIIGTVEGEPRLIARGSASVYETEALGIIPVDLIDMVDITIAYGLGASIDVALWRDVNKATPYAVMPPPVTAYVWTAMAGTVLAAFAAEKIDTNVVRLTLTEGQVASLPAKCWWSLSVTESGGLTTLVQGDVLVTGTPLPVFTTITAPYNYRKLATLGTPASGEALHCTNAPDLLRVSMFDNNGVDQSVYLSRVEAGSTITLLRRRRHRRRRGHPIRCRRRSRTPWSCREIRHRRPPARPGRRGPWFRSTAATRSTTSATSSPRPPRAPRPASNRSSSAGAS